ncbi:hypothetical protein [Flavobacterium sp. N3904]|uniref:hypothetical protein n=1 Tax=Flavobacterium sp. N3904 TaxID=2986835 RepID=UPI002224AF68|nr:hypothetical protein [Flavobacterium sp. N3904]
MKKAILLLGLLVVFPCQKVSCQTRQEDYDYILNHYLSDQVDFDYVTNDLTGSTVKKSNSINASLQFVNFSTKSDNKNRGIAVVYKERKSNNELVKTIVLCFPEKNSEDVVTNKAFKDLNALNDPFVLKYILAGFMKIGINDK